MCYSSQIAAAYQHYLKLTGATIDLDQFKEVYGFRHANASIRISPVVDRWFKVPKRADERATKELIDRHRVESTATLEGECLPNAGAAIPRDAGGHAMPGHRSTASRAG